MLELALQETRFYQDAKEDGRQEGRLEGRQEGQSSLVLRLLQRRVGSVSTETEAQISALPPLLIEELGEALLDFEELADLTTWLEQHSGQTDR